TPEFLVCLTVKAEDGFAR
ncbi:hypothetical protein A2U01_0114626, partial [Trifolium medium]|nr:hypothetical protein [Trifolium medium]